MDTTVKESKAYELRNLTSDDVFPMLDIISKIGIDEFRTVFESEQLRTLLKSKDNNEDTSSEKAEEQLYNIGTLVVLDIANVIIKKIPLCKQEIYLFLAQLSGMTQDEIKKLPMNTFFKMIIDVFKKDEFKDFIGVVSKLFK